MSIQDQTFVSPAGDRPGIGTDPGDAWGSRADGGIAPAFDYMDEDLEEAMIAIGEPEASPGPPMSVEGQPGPD